MTSAAAMGAVAVLVSTAFGLSTLERFVARRKPHELAWTVSLAMFALASFAYFWAAALGWSALDFRAFYLFGAILNVPWLALDASLAESICLKLCQQLPVLRIHCIPTGNKSMQRVKTQMININ